jgi:flagellin
MGRRVLNRSINTKLRLAEMADGALGDNAELLKRGRELAVQASSETYTSKERAISQQGYDQTLKEIDRIAKTIKYGDKDLIQFPGGVTGAGSKVHIGIRGTADDMIDSSIPVDSTLVGLNLDTSDISTLAGARAALESLDIGLDSVNEMRASMGGYRNRLESALDTNLSAMEGEQAAASRMRDADMAFEVSMKAQANLMSQTAVSAIAQAKQLQKGTIQQLVS